MEFTTDREELTDWFPLVMEGRDEGAVAATRMPTGTDVNYGALTSDLLNWLRTKEGFTIHFNSLVEDLKREGDGWDLRVKDQTSGDKRTVYAKFVFLGAGGGSETRRA